MTTKIGIVAKILEDKGEKWAEKTCGTTEPITPQQISDLVYYHFLESEDGERVWKAELEDDEEKVDEIFDSIYSKYTELGWMSEEEWTAISDHLYSMVYEGVF